MIKKKILVVDEDLTLAKLLKTALENSGRYEVHCVNEGIKAVAAVRSFDPDLVVLDVEMPDINGREIGLSIENDPKVGKTPVIFLTGTVAHGEIPLGMSLGNRPVLCKPIHMEEFIACIEKNIRK